MSLGILYETLVMMLVCLGRHGGAVESTVAHSKKVVGSIVGGAAN